MGSTAHNGAGTVLIARNRADLTELVRRFGAVGNRTELT